MSRTNQPKQQPCPEVVGVAVGEVEEMVGTKIKIRARPEPEEAGKEIEVRDRTGEAGAEGVAPDTPPHPPKSAVTAIGSTVRRLTSV